MRFFKRKTEVRADTQNEQNVDEVLLRALLGKTTISRSEALAIPTIQSCISLISGVISMLPIKLYEEKDGKVKEIRDDRRVWLLNKDTNDTLTACQFWKAMLEDYFLGKGGYAYINKNYAGIKSINYVEEEKISVLTNTDPIFKDYDLMVNGDRYLPSDFIKILRKTRDGCKSNSVIDENALIIGVAYHQLKYELNLVKKGGNKRGFLKSARHLTDPAMAALKDAYRKLYGNNEENVVVLNDGIEFQEASNTSVEMQMNENKVSNTIELAKIFNIPPGMLNKNPTKDDTKNFIKFTLPPILTDIEQSLDRDLLEEDEKANRYFAFDTRDISRGDIIERYQAYEIGIRNNILQVDEVRNQEDMPPLGIEWITLGLDKVLYNPRTKEVYTMNTNKTAKMDDLKGGESKDESGN